MRQNKFTSRPYPIDLHGVRHEYVPEILEKTLLGYHNTDGYEIITGNSAHMILIETLRIPTILDPQKPLQVRGFLCPKPSEGKITHENPPKSPIFYHNLPLNGKHVR